MVTNRSYRWFALLLAGALTLLSAAQIAAPAGGSCASARSSDDRREISGSALQLRHFLCEQRRELRSGIREVQDEVRSSRNELRREIREISQTLRSELRDLSRSLRESIREVVRELRPHLRRSRRDSAKVD